MLSKYGEITIEDTFKLMLRCKKLFESRPKLVDIVKAFTEFNILYESYRSLVNGKTNYEVTEEELKEIRDLADTVADQGHKILFKIKCLGEENTLIDRSEFVYRG